MRYVHLFDFAEREQRLLVSEHQLKEVFVDHLVRWYVELHYIDSKEE